TLLNAVLGSPVSIVTPKAQTTRERVLGILTQGTDQMVFVDTPGIHRARPGGINEFMINEAREALEAPEAVWYVVDPASGVNHEEAVLELLRGVVAPIFLLMNKQDVARAPVSRAFREGLRTKLEGQGHNIPLSLGISARRGDGLKELLKATWQFLPEGPMY